MDSTCSARLSKDSLNISCLQLCKVDCSCNACVQKKQLHHEYSKMRIPALDNKKTCNRHLPDNMQHFCCSISCIRSKCATMKVSPTKVIFLAAVPPIFKTMHTDYGGNIGALDITQTSSKGIGMWCFGHFLQLHLQSKHLP